MTTRSEDGNSLRLLGLPFKLGPEARPAEQAPPRLGEHTEAVLRDWLGLDAAQVAAAREAGAV